MKTLPLRGGEPWRRLCGKELGGLRRLKRRSAEAAPRSARGPRPAGGMLREAGGPSRPGGAAGLVARSEGAPPPGLEAAQPFPQPRILLRPPPPPPLESAYPASAGAHLPYPPAAAPRTRPGEAAGASAEIKAVQQTRRLLANARERTRVHTISAAFEALRKQVPCYSYGQKLSKLAILRIACNYILSLARLADMDYSADHSNMSFSECVEQCTRTLQAEGRSKKRKE